MVPAVVGTQNHRLAVRLAFAQQLYGNGIGAVGITVVIPHFGNGYVGVADAVVSMGVGDDHHAVLYGNGLFVAFGDSHFIYSPLDSAIQADPGKGPAVQVIQNHRLSLGLAVPVELDQDAVGPQAGGIVDPCLGNRQVHRIGLRQHRADIDQHDGFVLGIHPVVGIFVGVFCVFRQLLDAVHHLAEIRPLGNLQLAPGPAAVKFAVGVVGVEYGVVLGFGRDQCAVNIEYIGTQQADGHADLQHIVALGIGGILDLIALVLHGLGQVILRPQGDGIGVLSVLVFAVINDVAIGVQEVEFPDQGILGGVGHALVFHGTGLVLVEHIDGVGADEPDVVEPVGVVVPGVGPVLGGAVGGQGKDIGGSVAVAHIAAAIGDLGPCSGLGFGDILAGNAPFAVGFGAPDEGPGLSGVIHEGQIRDDTLEAVAHGIGLHGRAGGVAQVFLAQIVGVAPIILLPGVPGSGGSAEGHGAQHQRHGHQQRGQLG